MATRLYGGQHRFKNSEVGVARAGVIESAWIAMLKRGGGVDGWHHRAGFAREAFAVVNGPGGCRRFWDRTLQGVDAIYRKAIQRTFVEGVLKGLTDLQDENR